MLYYKGATTKLAKQSNQRVKDYQKFEEYRNQNNEAIRRSISILKSLIDNGGVLAKFKNNDPMFTTEKIRASPETLKSLKTNKVQIKQIYYVTNGLRQLHHLGCC